MAQQEFEYSMDEKKTFIPTTRTTYVYDENNMLIKEVAKGINTTEDKNYLYQFDNKENGNWVKQIVTPENLYISRKITYYEEDVITEE